jgi:hypothetical protein
LNDVDNDLFFRIRLVDPKSVTEQALALLEGEVRHFMSERPPLIFEIRRLDEIFVAAYEDDTLPRSSTQVWSLTDPRLNQDFIMSHLDS